MVFTEIQITSLLAAIISTSAVENEGCKYTSVLKIIQNLLRFRKAYLVNICYFL